MKYAGLALAWAVVGIGFVAASCGRDATTPADPAPPPIHRTWRVPEEFATIQEGLNHAEDGDTVLVAAGLYEGDGNRDLRINEKSVALVGESGPDSCVIDCGRVPGTDRRGISVIGTVAREVLIRGLTIRGGNAEAGGGLDCIGVSIRIERCCFEDNWADLGAGAALGGGRASVVDCTFRGNRAWEYEGSALMLLNGIFVLERCRVLGNEPLRVLRRAHSVSAAAVSRAS